MSMAIIAAGVGVAATVYSVGDKIHQSNVQKKLANQVAPVDATRQISPEMEQQLGLYRQLFNAQAPGASAQRDAIFTNQANVLDSADRNATSGSQAAAIAAATQGVTNKSIGDQQITTEQNRNNLLAGMGGAASGVATEEQQAYQDRVRKFNNDIAAKAALQSAAIQNRNSSVNDIARFGMEFGQNYGGLFGSGTGKPLGGYSGQNSPVSTIPTTPSYSNSISGNTTPTVPYVFGSGLPASTGLGGDYWMPH